MLCAFLSSAMCASLHVRHLIFLILLTLTIRASSVQHHQILSLHFVLKHYFICISAEVSRAVIAQIIVFWNVTSYSFVGGYRRLEGTCCIYHQVWNVKSEELVLLFFRVTLRLTVYRPPVSSRCPAPCGVHGHTFCFWHNREQSI
jgi:hypothetical protein